MDLYAKLWHNVIYLTDRVVKLLTTIIIILGRMAGAETTREKP